MGTQTDPEAIRRRLDARTAGPLKLDRDATNGPGMPFRVMAVEPGRGECVHLTSPGGLRQGDAVFHASAPEDIRALLEREARLRQLLMAAASTIRGLIGGQKKTAEQAKYTAPDVLAAIEEMIWTEAGS